MLALLPDPVHMGAVISDCGLWRYRLWRVWDPKAPRLVVCMLNPSTADETEDDATIRKVCGFARLWSLGGVEVVNLFAYRATDPGELEMVLAEGAIGTAIGGENDEHIAAAIELAPKDLGVWCAWGAHGGLANQDRDVLKLIRDAGRRTFHVGPLTKAGFPRHPLYLPYAAARAEYAGRPLES
jgi:hypothetical protein